MTQPLDLAWKDLSADLVNVLAPTFLSSTLLQHSFFNEQEARELLDDLCGASIDAGGLDDMALELHLWKIQSMQVI